MKLYVNEDRTQWRGTQADAKAAFGSIDQFEVPTDKQGLIDFLNKYSLKQVVHKMPDETVEETIIRARELKYIRENTPKPDDSIAARCSLVDLKALSTTLNQLLQKTWSEMERHHE